jgi:hypothetical protein
MKVEAMMITSQKYRPYMDALVLLVRNNLREYDSKVLLKRT